MVRAGNAPRQVEFETFIPRDYEKIKSLGDYAVLQGLVLATASDQYVEFPPFERLKTAPDLFAPGVLPNIEFPTVSELAEKVAEGVFTLIQNRYPDMIGDSPEDLVKSLRGQIRRIRNEELRTHSWGMDLAREYMDEYHRSLFSNLGGLLHRWSAHRLGELLRDGKAWPVNGTEVLQELKEGLGQHTDSLVRVLEDLERDGLAMQLLEDTFTPTRQGMRSYALSPFTQAYFG